MSNAHSQRNYDKPPGSVSRHTGRKVATGADGKPLWLRKEADNGQTPRAS